MWDQSLPHRLGFYSELTFLWSLVLFLLLAERGGGCGGGGVRGQSLQTQERFLTQENRDRKKETNTSRCVCANV